jgi:hypothetical protein
MAGASAPQRNGVGISIFATIWLLSVVAAYFLGFGAGFFSTVAHVVTQLSSGQDSDSKS